MVMDNVTPETPMMKTTAFSTTVILLTPTPMFVRIPDGDTCDDCTMGTDGFGTNADNTPLNDGLDTDGDGLCDAGDSFIINVYWNLFRYRG